MTADLGGRRRPTANRAIVAVGLKALAFDSSPPLVCDEPAATYERASDEHGRLAVSAATNRLALGDKLRRDVIHNSGSGLSALGGIGMELHKRRRRLGCSSVGLGGLGRRVNPQQQADHQALPKKS